MNESFYRQVLEDSAIGYAYHEIICDKDGCPCDYRFIDINQSFEKLTGLQRKNVIGQTILKIMPDIQSSAFDWISFYGHVALGGGDKEFEQYSESLSKYYHVKVYSPEKYFFITIFNDITSQKQLIEISKKLIEHSESEIDYQKITDDMLLLSKAKYVAFNLFDENGRDFRTVGMSGIRKNMIKVTSMIGFDFIGRKWSYDPVREQRISGSSNTIHFKGLYDLAREVIPEKITVLIENIFGIGPVTLIKIMKDGTMLGDFTLFMDKSDTLDHKETAEIYASQVGLFLGKKKAERKLHDNQIRLELAMDAGEHGFWDWNLGTGEMFFSPGFYSMLGYKTGELALNKDNWLDLMHSSDRHLIVPMIDKCVKESQPFDEEFRLKCKDGTWKWISGKVKHYTEGEKSTLDRIVGVHVDISKMKQAQDAVVFQQKRLEDIIEATHLGTWEWNVQTGETRFNERWAEIIGYSLDELSPAGIHTWMNHVHPVDLKTSDMMLKEVFQGKRSHYEIDCRLRHKNGTWIWVHDQGKVVSWTEEGLPLLMSGTHADISSRKKMEKQLQESNERFEQLAEQSRTINWEVDQNGLYTNISQVSQKVLGFSPDELVEKKYFYDLFLDAEREGLKAAAFRCFEKKEAFTNFINCIQKKDGQTIWVSTNAFPLLDASFTLIGYRGADLDITDVKEAEMKVEESEKNYRMFFETIDDLIFVSDLTGKILYTNGAVSRKTGFTLAELNGRDILDVHSQDHRKDAEEIFRGMLEGARDVCPLPIMNKNGSALPVETRVCFGEWNGKKCIFGISKDLSKEQEALQKFNKLFNNNPALMAVSTVPNGIFTDINNAFTDSLGYTKADVLGKTVSDLDLFVEPEKQRKLAVKLRETGKISNYELKVKTKNGQLIDGLFSGETIESQNKSYFLTVMKDISEIKKAEHLLQERDQLLTKLSHNLPGTVFQFLMKADGTFCFPFASEGIWDIFEIMPDDVKSDGSIAFSRIHPDDYVQVIASMRYSFDNLTIWEDQCRAILPQKGLIWVRGLARPEKLEDGSVLWHGYLRDNTDIKKAEESLRDSENRYRYERELFRTTLMSVGDGVISTDASGNIIIMNKVAESLTEWSQKDAFGKPLEQVFHIINEFTREKCGNPAQTVLESGMIIELANHTMLISKSGVEIPIEDSAAPIRDRDGRTTGVVIVFRDFTEKREKMKQVEYLSFHDQLTGLHNRRFFEEELKRIDTEINLPITLVMLDVNGLKLTNDAFGHRIGDELLMKVADILVRKCRAGDIISRIGGDEFVIVLPGTSEMKAQRLMKKIKHAFSEEKVAGIHLSVSSGTGTKINSRHDIQDTMKQAEDHMYRDKISDRSSQRYETIQMIMKTLNEKIPREQLHSDRVSEFCCKVGIDLGLNPAEISELTTTAVLHDIGKIAISNSTLNKEGELNYAEWLEVKRHPEVGYNILSSVNDYAPLADIVLAHHERWDGQGYPKNLKGRKIPLHARIIAVADAYDAMTQDRPYRKSISSTEAAEELLKYSGSQFDPQIVKVFIKCIIGQQ